MIKENRRWGDEHRRTARMEPKETHEKRFIRFRCCDHLLSSVCCYFLPLYSILFAAAAAASKTVDLRVSAKATACTHFYLNKFTWIFHIIRFMKQKNISACMFPSIRVLLLLSYSPFRFALVVVRSSLHNFIINSKSKCHILWSFFSRSKCLAERENDWS